MLLYYTLHRIQYSMNVTFTCTGKPKNWYDLLYCSDLKPNPQYLQGKPIYSTTEMHHCVYPFL